MTSSEFTIFRDYLKMNKLRQTPQRDTILKIFLSMEGHVTAEALHNKAREVDPSIGIATTYRTLILLVQSGLIRENDDVNGKKYKKRGFFSKFFHQISIVFIMFDHI